MSRCKLDHEAQMVTVYGVISPTQAEMSPSEFERASIPGNTFHVFSHPPSAPGPRNSAYRGRIPSRVRINEADKYKYQIEALPVLASGIGWANGRCS